MALKFIKKGLKKFYKSAKKYVKKLDNPLVLAGLTFFAAGVGVAGFSAFKGSAGQGLTGFLGAVGKTTVMGAQGIGGALGLTAGVSGNMASGIEGVNAGDTLFGGNTGMYDASGSRIVQNFTDNIQRSSASPNRIMPGDQPMMGGGMGGLFGGGQNSALLLSGISSGIRGYQANREYKRERKRMKNLNFFGGPAVGGDSELSFPMPQFANVDERDDLGSPMQASPIFGG